MDYNEMSKESLIKLLDKQFNKNLEKRATLKELTTTSILKYDTLFIIPSGYIIGKPFVDEEPFVSGYIILSEVIFIDSLCPPIKKSVFNGMSFHLAIDQIIAFSQIDRDSFLHQLESHSDF